MRTVSRVWHAYGWRALLLAAATFLVGRPGAAQSPTVGEIREHYLATLSSLEAVDVRYTFYQEAAPSRVFERDGLPVPGILPTIHAHVIRQPGRWFNETITLQADGLARDSISLVSFDGSRAFTAGSDPESGGIDVTHVGIRIPTNDSPVRRQRTEIEMFLGQRIPGLQGDSVLADLMDQHAREPAVADNVDGGSAWRAEFVGRHDPDTDYEITAWFDPSHGWLPRRLEVLSRRGSAGPLSESSYTIDVHTFVALDDSETVWFPSIAVNTAKYSTGRLQVESVASAKHLRPADFAIDIPDGVDVVEQRADGSTRRYVKGVPTDVNAMVRASAAAARAAAMRPPVEMPTTSVVTGRRPHIVIRRRPGSGSCQ